jgi:hypothetical protein
MLMGWDPAVDVDMNDGDAGHGEEDQTGVERVTAGKDLSGERVRRFDGTHPAQQHRGVQEGVDPGEPFELSIAHHAQGERADDDRGCDGEVGRQAAKEQRERQRRNLAVFVQRHHDSAPV